MPNTRVKKSSSCKILINFFSEKQALLNTLQRQWFNFLNVATKSKEPVSVALSGGRIAPELFNSFAEITLNRFGNVSQVNLHFFWADERCVPMDSPESNFNIANRYLFQPLKINGNQIHRIRGELEPETAAALATEEFVRIKKNRQIFDLIILGMGEDGHVASLFPQEPEDVINDKSIYRNVVAVKPPPNRITLGYQPIINAKSVWVVISEDNKADAFANSLPPHFKTPLGRILKARKSTNLFYYS